MRLPHDGVFARLAPSPIHGIGVFAILPIKKGTFVFEPDDDVLVDVATGDTDRLPDAIRKLYTDFCLSEMQLFNAQQVLIG